MTSRGLNYLLVGVLALFLSACAAKRPDTTLFASARPKSILVLPPLNQTAAVGAPEKFLSTISFPLAERGYYVFPVAIVERMLKENGVAGPEEMRQISREKLREIFGADALLDVAIKKWGTSYIVLSSTTTVALNWKLIDLRDGQELWSYSKSLSEGSGGGGGLIGALVSAAVHSISSVDSDNEVPLAAKLNKVVLMHNGIGLLRGPRLPEPKS